MGWEEDVQRRVGVAKRSVESPPARNRAPHKKSGAAFFACGGDCRHMPASTWVGGGMVKLPDGNQAGFDSMVGSGFGGVGNDEREKNSTLC